MPKVSIHRAHRTDGAANRMAQHHRLQTECAYGVFQLFDCFRGRVHRDDGGGRDPVGVGAILVGDVAIEGTAGSAAQFFIFDRADEQAGGRIENREVEAKLVEPLVKQPRQDRGSAVERVLAGNDPEGFLRDAGLAPLGGSHAQRIADPVIGPLHRIGDPLSANFLEILENRWAELYVVSVGIDYGIAELFADRPGRFIWMHERTSLKRPTAVGL